MEHKRKIFVAMQKGEPMDLIERQAAIDALCSECQGRCIPCKNYPCSEVKSINALPSAQTEPCRQVAGKLEPCPFCGNEPTISCFKGKDGWRDRYAVICRYDEGGCGAESGLYHYEAEALEAWNRRVGETDVTV